MGYQFMDVLNGWIKVFQFFHKCIYLSFLKIQFTGIASRNNIFF